MNAPGRWFDERVEAYLDGALEERELALFEAELARSPALAGAVETARSLADALAGMPRYRSPTDLTPRLERVTAVRPRRRPRAGRRSLAAAATVAALAAGLWLGTRPGDDAISPAELAAARRELAVALAYLDRANARLGREVGSQLLGEGLAPSLRPGRRGPPRLEDSS